MCKLFKKTTLVLIGLSIANFVNAKESHLSCSQLPAKIHYVNGVNTPDPVVNLRVVERMDRYLSDYDIDEKGVVFNPPTYNHYDGQVGDIFDSIYLRLRNIEHTGWSDIEIKEATSHYFSSKDRFFRFVQVFLTVDIAREMADEIASFAKLETPGEISTLAAYIAAEINLGHKILLTSHSGGTMFSTLVYEEVFELLGRDKAKMQTFAGVMLAAAATYLPSDKNGGTNFRYIRSQNDHVIETFAPGAMAPNIVVKEEDNSKFDLAGHSVIDIYLNPLIQVKVGTKTISMTDLFSQKVREAITGLINTDTRCCSKRAGKLWLNENNCEGNDCLGGFIENGISYNRLNKNLFVDRAAQVCKSITNTAGTPGIAGNVDIKGKVILGDNSKIIGASSFSSPISMGSDGGTIDMRGQSIVKAEGGKAPKVKGNMFIAGTSVISGGGTYEGEGTLIPNVGGTASLILNSNLSGSSKIEGFYYFAGATIESAEINGVISEVQGSPYWTAVYGEVKNAKMTGLSSIGLEGKLLDGARLDGYIVGNTGGVSVSGATVEGAGTEIKGSVLAYINVNGGAKITGNRAPGVGLMAIYLHGSSDNQITGGNLSGGGESSSSSMNGATGSGCYWYIWASELNGDVFKGQVWIGGGEPQGDTTWDMPDSPGCTPAPEVRRNRNDDYFTKMFNPEVFRPYVME